MKRALSLALCLLLAVGFALPVAAANRVNSIGIQAVVHPDGSMYVQQTWDGTFDTGTECYIPMNAPDYLTISDLRVADQNGVYQTLENWDVNATQAQKTGKCGIVTTNSGYEICFGIGEYGRNRYAIEYTLQNVIGSYTDYDGVNFRFVNDGMSTTPTDVTLEIRLADGTPITDENCDIWGFGFAGQIGFEDGAIKAYTEQPLSSDNHVTVLLALSKGILSPARAENDSFESVKQTAMEGSDYDYDSGAEQEGGILETLLGIILMFAPVVGIFFLIKNIGKDKRRLAKFTKDCNYFREAPNGGNRTASYALGRRFGICEDGSILGMDFLRLIDSGCLAPLTQESVGFMGKTKETVSLRLVGYPSSKADEFDEYLYTVLEAAAGADGILQEKELQNYIKIHSKLLTQYVTKCDEVGKGYLSRTRCLTSLEHPARFASLTEQGKRELAELIGFKRYLEDFSLIAERGVTEMPIWKELLSYALLFGIADKVAEQLKNLYPNLSLEIQQYGQYIYTANAYSLALSRQIQEQRRQEQTARSGGSGGFTSIGGGGGSIGGGSGGGTR